MNISVRRHAPKPRHEFILVLLFFLVVSTMMNRFVAPRSLQRLVAARVPHRAIRPQCFFSSTCKEEDDEAIPDYFQTLGLEVRVCVNVGNGCNPVYQYVTITNTHIQ
jgi:hypothetical protein